MQVQGGEGEEIKGKDIRPKSRNVFVVLDGLSERLQGINSPSRIYYENIDYLFNVISPKDGISQE